MSIQHEPITTALPIQFGTARLRKNDRLLDEVITAIGGDRRARRRIPIELDVAYTVVNKRRISHSGTGKTCDMNGTGLAFRTGDVLERGSRVTLSVAWPVSPVPDCCLRLHAEAKVVRSDRQVTAVRVRRYEFRMVDEKPERAIAAGYAFSD